jgi:hypothetical protein
MAETQADIGFGCQIQRGNGAVPEVFTTVLEQSDINPPEFMVDKHEVTHHQSPLAHKEKVPGLIDTGDVSGKGNLVETDATQDEVTGILADARNRTIRNWRFVYPNGTKTLQFRGFVTRWKGTTPLNGPKTVEWTLTVKSAPTFV